MRKIYLLAVLLAAAAIPARAQSATNTDCQANGNQVNCTSNTTGSTNSTTNTNCQTNANQMNCTSNTSGTSTSNSNDAVQAERQREMYQSGQAAGVAIGNLILKHRINSFCKKHPGGWVQPQGYSRIECSDWNAVHQKQK